MKRIAVHTSAVLAILGFAFSAAAQEREQTQRDRQQKAERQNARSGAQGEQQTIRGRVAGVTSIGEAVIDPVTNAAIIAEVDYLTVLGSPASQQRGQRQGNQGNQEQRDQTKEQGQSEQASRGPSQGSSQQRRQNLYLIALTPETSVREGQQRGPDAAGRGEGRQDRAASQAAFAKLEIGDRVEVQFVSTQRLSQAGRRDATQDRQGSRESAEKDTRAGEQRGAGFRGNQAAKKHGKNRIVVGEASAITLLPENTQQGERQGSSSQERSQGSGDSRQ